MNTYLFLLIFILAFFMIIELKKPKKYTVLLILIIAILQLVGWVQLPVELNPEQVVVKEVGEWVINSSYSNRTIYNEYPFFSYVLDLYNVSVQEFRITNILGGEEPLNGSIILYDTHFCVKDSRIPIKIFQSEKYKLINTFSSKKIDFIVYVFEKVK